MDSHHVVKINDIDVICLDHGFTDPPILSHPFFGTSKVIDELKKDKDGWEKGLIVIMDYKPYYNNTDKSGLVDGFNL